VKRSKSIRLILIGGLSAGGLTGCGDGTPGPISSEDVYTNNYFVAGVGYYHAPFRAWFPLPYNHFDPRTQRYFYGGQWGAAPLQNLTNISPPTPLAAQQAQAQRLDIHRGGFGGTSGGHTWVGS
jgi:hypothetical protein